MINKPLRIAFWAMFLSFGMTILLAIPDPDAAPVRAEQRSSPPSSVQVAQNSPKTTSAASAQNDSTVQTQNQHNSSPGVRLGQSIVPVPPSMDGPAHPDQTTGKHSENFASSSSQQGRMETEQSLHSGDAPFRFAQAKHKHFNPRHHSSNGERSQPMQNRASTSGKKSRVPPLSVPQIADVRKKANQQTRSDDSSGRSKKSSVVLGPIEAPEISVRQNDSSHTLKKKLREFAPKPSTQNHSSASGDDSHLTSANEAEPEKTISPAARKMEARLAGLQRRVDQLIETQLDAKAKELERTTQLVQQLQQRNQLQEIEKQLEKMKAEKAREKESVPKKPGKEPSPQSESGTDQEASPTTDSQSNHDKKQPKIQAQPTAGNPEKFSLQIEEGEIKKVLEMLGQLAGLNILVGKDISGTISANLHNVTVDEALHAILRSQGYVFEREDDFIYVMTTAEAETRKKLDRKLITKIYRPHYINVKELETLITPLISETVGQISVTNPSETGIASDPENAGGNQLAQRDALLVQDYPEVIEEIDGVVQQMDVPPMQVVIEAMILSVKLTDEMEFGVNFALLNDTDNNLVASGNGQTLQSSAGFPGTGKNKIVPPAGQFLADAAGLKYGFIRGDISAFIQALENISDTNLVAAPQLRVINKQKAELIIGDRISYKTLAFNGNQTVENVNFLDSGTKLFFRPFIAPDGLVRLEVHPERSSAVIDPQTGLPNQATTEVTTNVMVRDGATVVIGGLIEEQITESFDQIPLLGSIPLVGNAFRSKSERIDRTELIVLITPRIIREPQDAIEGESLQTEFERRSEHFRRNLSPINRQNLARMHTDRALYFLKQGELTRARHHIEKALEIDKNDLEALRLRDRIDAAFHQRTHKWLPWKRFSSSSPPHVSQKEKRGKQAASAKNKPLPTIPRRR